MAKTPPKLPQLGELELAVLEHLWIHWDADVHEAHAAIGKRRGISPNTVGSALERLYRKGLASRAKVSHAYRYRAAIDRETFLARKMLEAVGGIRSLGKHSVLAAFVDLVADADRTALVELERMVRRKRQQLGP
jgi:predicted transcriptional regulator